MTTTRSENVRHDDVAGNGLKLRLRRVIGADRGRVFEAWTKPEAMRAWFAPGNMTIPSLSTDVRAGGAYRVEMRGSIAVHNGTAENQAMDPVVVAHGVYREIVANERISYTWTGSWDPREESLVLVTLKQVHGGTELALTHEGFLSEQSRNTHQTGWESSLSKLKRLFEAS